MEKRIISFQNPRILLLCILVLASLFISAQKQDDQIRVNQVGYYPNSPKIAVITGKLSSEYFYIVSADGKDTLYQNILGREKKSEFSSGTTRIADFSSFKKTGHYIIRASNKQSFPFEIKNEVYAELGRAVLKSFYYQRSSISSSSEERYVGKWSRTAKQSGDVVIIHPTDFTDNRGTIISSPGGWYDKGDFNKYIVSSAITMSTLLSAYEDFSHYFDSLDTNVPESNDKIPDILNEILYNLRWMFTMQDPFDGGVYYKCSNLEFNNPEAEGSVTKGDVVVQKTTAAALDYAAAMAQAGRVFKIMKLQLPGLSDSCLRASANAWLWALKNPHSEYDADPIDKEYKTASFFDSSDDQLDDEWMWAATEMFITSRNKIYFDVIGPNIDKSVSLPSCNNVRMLAYYSLLRYQDYLPAYARDIVEPVRQRLLKMADNFLIHSSSSAFATVMGQSTKDFTWGSNSIAAHQGILLINAYLLTGDQKYIEGAMSNLDYLLGRNATGYCFVTGFGTQSPMHPHYRHLLTDAIDKPVPGLLVGGPNAEREGGRRHRFSEIETAYVDKDDAYACNQISLSWNASITYMANAIEAMQYGLGFSSR